MSGTTKLKDLAGELLVVTVKETLGDVPTRYGTTPAVVVSVTRVNTKPLPDTFTTRWFAPAVVAELTPHLGGTLIGKVQWFRPKGGAEARPYLIFTESTNPDEIVAALNAASPDEPTPVINADGLLGE